VTTTIKTTGTKKINSQKRSKYLPRSTVIALLACYHSGRNKKR